MAAEHCVLGGCDHEFTTGNYKITTTPRKEWMYIVGDENGQRWECPESDMHHDRRIVSIDEYMRKERVKAVGLNRAEVIALISYSGPMVCCRDLCCFLLCNLRVFSSQWLTRQLCLYLTIWPSFKFTIQCCVDFPGMCMKCLKKRAIDFPLRYSPWYQLW